MKVKSFRGQYLTTTAATVAKITDAKIRKKDIKEISELGLLAEYIQYVSCASSAKHACTLDSHKITLSFVIIAGQSH